MKTRQNRLLDDLHWCLHSAPLIRPDEKPHIWPDTLWCKQLEPGRPSPLPLPDDLHHFRLGQHFERLLKTWIDNREDMHIIQANLQVQDGKRTVGEFDFLIDRGHVTEHWEAAVKFYLGAGNTREMSAWYGPNTADRLDLKFDRLVKLQLNLSTHPAARRCLADLNINVEQVRCFMKGRLFYPWVQYHEQAFEFPDLVNPDHEKGWWIPLDQFKVKASANDRYVPLNKIDWLSPIKTSHGPEPLSLQAFLSRLNHPDTQQATHVAIVNQRDEEQSRGFIVTDQWLARIDADSRN